MASREIGKSPFGRESPRISASTAFIPELPYFAQRMSKGDHVGAVGEKTEALGDALPKFFPIRGDLMQAQCGVLRLAGRAHALDGGGIAVRSKVTRSAEARGKIIGSKEQNVDGFQCGNLMRVFDASGGLDLGGNQRFEIDPPMH